MVTSNVILGSMFGAKLAGVGGTKQEPQKVQAEVVENKPETPTDTDIPAKEPEPDMNISAMSQEKAEEIAAKLLNNQRRRRNHY